ncbi:MAG: prepilin-type N-terminal cleavage/methylation domain-containing protein [Eubacterium sp.]
MSLKKSLKNNKGFTLVELIVVLVILAILAAFTIPAMLGFVEDAKGKAAIAEAREVYIAVQAIATEASVNDPKDFPLDEIMQEKLPELLAGDINIVGNEIGAIVYDEEPGIKPSKKIGIAVGKMDTSEIYSVKGIQYLDKTGKYKITIKPGEIAQIEKA